MEEKTVDDRAKVALLEQLLRNPAEVRRSLRAGGLDGGDRLARVIRGFRLVEVLTGTDLGGDYPIEMLDDPSENEIDHYLLVELIVRRRDGRWADAAAAADALQERRRADRDMADPLLAGLVYRELGFTSLRFARPELAREQLRLARHGFGRWSDGGAARYLLQADVTAVRSLADVACGDGRTADFRLQHADRPATRGWFARRVRARFALADAVAAAARRSPHARVLLDHADDLGAGELWPLSVEARDLLKRSAI